MSLANLNDESVLTLYRNIQLQVEAERHLKWKLVNSDSVRSYANMLRDELTRRQLQHSPIDWPRD